MSVDKEYIKRLAGSVEFIPGIYNYCDRWCERCPYTSRCMNFAVSEKHFEDPESRDIHNEAFWRKLKEIFSVARELLEEMIQERGIDLGELETTDFDPRTAERDPLARTAMAYGQSVEAFFGQAQDPFGESADEERSDIPSLEDVEEVIRWYQYLIPVKLMRAVSSDGLGPDADADFELSDENGSAKVALIAIDRSLAAWQALKIHCPAREAEVLDRVAQLVHLQREIEERFPQARAFRRPGFDTLDRWDHQ